MYKCGCARDEDDDTVWVKVDPHPRGRSGAARKEDHSQQHLTESAAKEKEATLNDI